MIDYIKEKKCWSGSYCTGDLFKLLDISSVENILLTSFGKLQPPLGNHCLKVNNYFKLLRRHIWIVNYNIAETYLCMKYEIITLSFT